MPSQDQTQTLGHHMRSRTSQVPTHPMTPNPTHTHILLNSGDTELCGSTTNHVFANPGSRVVPFWFVNKILKSRGYSYNRWSSTDTRQPAVCLHTPFPVHTTTPRQVLTGADLRRCRVLLCLDLSHLLRHRRNPTPTVLTGLMCTSEGLHIAPWCRCGTNLF